MKWKICYDDLGVYFDGDFNDQDYNLFEIDSQDSEGVRNTDYANKRKKEKKKKKDQTGELLAVTVNPIIENVQDQHTLSSMRVRIRRMPPSMPLLEGVKVVSSEVTAITSSWMSEY
jgi:hypothetical protein